VSTYVIGDIQGCMPSLERLLKLLALDWSQDSLWIAGDLVNRGPHSLEVLRTLKHLQESYPGQLRCVLGNHDLHLLLRYYGLTHERKGDTLAAVLQAPDADALIEWLQQQPLLQRDHRWLMVHAGLLPSWTEEQAEHLALELQQALLSHPAEFLGALYGNQPDCWDDHLQGIERYRVIVNAMTRMRFCTKEGQMEFHAKGQPQHAPHGFYPWYSVPHRRRLETTVLFGHWSQLGLRCMPGAISLDTGCLWGGTLTALRLEDKHFFQVA
jgi:bis(5'-nucleosyl)-tetraphosphatase (symmetrical)